MACLSAGLAKSAAILISSNQNYVSRNNDRWGACHSNFLSPGGQILQAPALFSSPQSTWTVSADWSWLFCDQRAVHHRICTSAISREISAGTEVDHRAKEACNVNIYDTTLRDGSQMVGISFSVGDKLKIARALIELGVAYIEGGWPGSNPKDAEFFNRWPEISQGQSGPRRTKVAAFGSTRHKNSTCEKDANVQALRECGAEVITLVGKAWDVQVTRVLEASLEENLNMIRDTVAYFKDLGREVMLDAEHFFDGFKSNREYSFDCLRAAAEAGADAVILCDTNGGSLPWEVEAIVTATQEALSEWPNVRIGIHTHNDCDLAVANSLAAVRAGATIVQGCMNGYGERAGNANLVSVIGGLQVKMGINCVPSETLARLAEISTATAELAGQVLLPSQPYVGSSAFAHKGGIHVAAVRKMPESYNHMDPCLVGNSMRSVVSELSGRGNIFDKAEKAGLTIDRETAGSVLARIKQMESEGCAFENAGASVDMLIVRKGKDYVQPFRVLEYSVIASNRGEVMFSSSSKSSSLQEACSEEAQPHDDVAKRRGGVAVAVATHQHECGSCNVNQAMLKLQVGDRIKMTAAEGHGPIDALSNALRDSLESHFPQLKQIELSDYKVRLLERSDERRGSDSASTTRVTMEFSDKLGKKWNTVGANTSIVEASFQALVDGLEFGIVHCSEDGCAI